MQEEEIRRIIIAHGAMSEDEKERQRRSFVYGNVGMSNPSVTRELVEDVASMPPADRTAIVRTARPGRRFFLPPGYSLASRPGKRHVFTVAMYASQEYDDPEAAARGAWEHAGLPAPAKLWEHVR